MDFINGLVREESIRIYPLFKRFNVGEYDVSAQASPLHRCEPETYSEDATIYSEMEVRFYKDGEAISDWENHPVLKDLIDYDDGDGYGVYVPVEFIEQVCFCLAQEV